MRKRIALVVIAISALAINASAQMPPGKWWRRLEIAQTLGLTPDQQSRLDAVFRTAANDLIDQRAEVEKLNVALRGELDQTDLNKANLQKLAQRLGEARGKLFERELMMLVDMRGVLHDDQWSRLRAELERRQERQQIDRNPMPRPDMNQRQPKRQ